MELNFDLSSLSIPGCVLKSPLSKLENSKIQWARKARQQSEFLLLSRAIDDLAKLSAEAQSIKKPVTTFERFLDAQDEQALYLLWKDEKINGCGEIGDGTVANGEKNGEIKNGGHEDLLAVSQNGTTPKNVLLGYLKIVRDRRLYLVNERSRRYVHTPICVLDFYIHSSVQHHGCGLELFNGMLKSESTTPQKCAFDKPSSSLLHFLEKHYGLKHPIWQPTTFVVFPEFFEGLKPEDGGKDEIIDDHQMSAIERNRKNINEHYSGSPQHLPVHGQRNLTSHCTTQSSMKDHIGEDTPRGRKNTRDYGHQSLW
ncbi:unnamed protein product [Meloidogyne enterolobii]|uniref:Uncharacterized protein n=3 Tax=Meloidogyne enterolobii TaxID=390850 RepID=A0ACB0Z0F8_MELEN|nr:unnamed protein product [Meloidogyne enterolobii]